MSQTVASNLVKTTLIPLNLRDINLIVFPDWCQTEACICADLFQVIESLSVNSEKSQTTLLVDTRDIPDESANLILSAVTMNLLMQEDLDVSEGPEISLLGQLEQIQWDALLPHIQARIVLANENQQAIAQARAGNVPLRKLNTLV